MISRRLLRCAALAVACVVATTCLVVAQPYPSKLIRMVAPFPAGGPTDGAARLIADRLSVLLGQTIVVENRPGGAGGTVGVKSVASAAPDGYTLLFTPPGPLATAPAIFRNVGYDPASAFAPVAAIFASPQILVVNPGVPANSLQELVVHAKVNPKKVSYASPGFGTQPHLLGEMLKLMTGADIVHVPYKGSAAVLADLIAGQVQMYFDTTSFLIPHLEAGRLRALAVADTRRIPQWPDLPTTSEAGFGKLQATFWTGVLVPAGTPAPIIERLNAAINAVLKSKEMETTLANMNATPKPGSPEDFAAFLTAERARWSEIITAAGIKAE